MLHRQTPFVMSMSRLCGCLCHSSMPERFTWAAGLSCTISCLLLLLLQFGLFFFSYCRASDAVSTFPCRSAEVGSVNTPNRQRAKGGRRLRRQWLKAFLPLVRILRLPESPSDGTVSRWSLGSSQATTTTMRETLFLNRHVFIRTVVSNWMLPTNRRYNGVCASCAWMRHFNLQKYDSVNLEAWVNLSCTVSK